VRVARPLSRCGGEYAAQERRERIPGSFGHAFNSWLVASEKATLTKRVVELTQRFDVARSLALPEEKSLDLIRAYLREYEHEEDEDDS
jgi:hypothetical protein